MTGTHSIAPRRLALALAGLIALGLAAPASAQVAAGPLKCNFRKAKSKPGAAVLAPPVKAPFTPVPLESVQLIDRSLTKAVQVQSVAARRTETDTVEVVARLVNCTKDPLRIQARVSFLATDMAPTEPTSGWRQVFLDPTTLGVYSEKSTSVSAAHYLIEVRRAD
jgi:hypothetical protein